MVPMRSQSAFSLVELSIVLVILGLLTGGILGGQALIRAAELRAVSADVSRYTSAIQAFRDKYMALPGDMPNAVKFWGAQAGGTADGVDATCTALDSTSPATGPATCNGNGNGQIGVYFTLINNSNVEPLRAWQHLANAGLIEGQYTGVGNVVSPALTAGANAPASRIRPGVFTLVFFGQTPNASWLYPSAYGHVLNFGNPANASYHHMGYGAILRTEEAWNIDTKMDDGKPALGSVMTGLAGNTRGVSDSAACADNANPSSANYALATTGTQCGLIFKTGI